MKKNIFFFALSSSDLMDLYKILKIKYNIIWIVYYKDVYEILKKENIKEIYYLNPSLRIFESKNIFIKLIRYLISFFNIKIKNKNFFKSLQELEKNYNPKIIFTDTSQLLANYQTRALKINTRHSVCYKKYFLNEVNFKYDYILLPGNYHKERIKKIYNLKNVDEKFKVVGNIKISQFLKNNNFNRTNFIKSMNLDPAKKNVLFAPSWDAHENNFFGKPRFLPKKYGNQYSALEKIAKNVDQLNCNFIIKLHHLSHFHLKDKVFKVLDDLKNCFIFKSAAYHDISSSDDIFRVSDIIVTNTSGVASTGIFLKKKLVFINPRSSYNWSHSDLEKELRPGFICDSFDEVIKGIENYSKDKDPYIKERENFVEKIFSNPTEDANVKIAKLIPQILSEN